MWPNKDPIATIDETTKTEEPNVLIDTALGCSFLEAADGAGSLTFATPRFFSVSLKQPLTAPELRHLAVKHFVRAADAFQGNPDAFPREPWVRFQIGWYSFAYEDGPRDLRLARSSLERVLELDPDNAPAHLALAWLLNQERQGEEAAASIESAPAWDSAIGEHLRSALHPRLESSLAVDIHYGRDDEYSRKRTAFPYIVVESGHSLMLQALEELDAIVPDSHRFAFAMAHYHVCTGNELALAYLEEAIKWPLGDELALCEAHERIAVMMIKHGRDLTKGYKHFAQAYKHVLRLAEYDHDAAYNFVAERTDRLFWFPTLPRDISLLRTARTAFLEYVDAFMDLFNHGMLAFCGVEDIDGFLAAELGEPITIAGWLQLNAGQIPEATSYLTHALEFDQVLAESDDWKPSSDLNWRVLLARGWRDICLRTSDYAEAHKQNERILNWLPDDREALDLKLKLAPILLTAYHHNQSSQELAHIRAGTEFLVQEAVLDHSANERLQRLLGQYGDDPHGMDSIMDQLNNLIQKGSKIQAAAWRIAGDRAISELGNDVFSNLHLDSQHFLTTAEALYAASENVASEMDASPIVIEYAKVVETELRNRFLPALARGLEAERFKGALRAGQEEIRFSGPGKWERKISNLSLGNAINLLQHAIEGTDNRPIWKILERLQPHPNWFRDLTHDLDEVVRKYRNGAAHTERVRREAATELRDLLFTRGLLRRLVELKKLCDKIPSID